MVKTNIMVYVLVISELYITGMLTESCSLYVKRKYDSTMYEKEKAFTCLPQPMLAQFVCTTSWLETKRCVALVLSHHHPPTKDS